MIKISISEQHFTFRSSRIKIVPSLPVGLYRVCMHPVPFRIKYSRLKKQYDTHTLNFSIMIILIIG
jgi:hypothetical protein